MRQEASPPSLQTAIDQVATHGRALVANRIELLTLEGKEAVAKASKRLFETTLAILVGFCGFVLITLGATLKLAEHLGIAQAALSIGGGYLTIALVLCVIAFRTGGANKTQKLGAQGTEKAKEAEHALH